MAETNGRAKGRVVRIGRGGRRVPAGAELPEIDTALTLDVDLGGETTTIVRGRPAHRRRHRARDRPKADGVVGRPVENWLPDHRAGGRGGARSRLQRAREPLDTTADQIDPDTYWPMPAMRPRSPTSSRRGDARDRHQGDRPARAVQGGKIGMFGGAGVGKTVIVQEMMPPGRTARRRLGLRGCGRADPRGHDLFIEMTESGVIEKTALVFGQMDEPRACAAACGAVGARWLSTSATRSTSTCCCSWTTSSGSHRRVRSRPCSGRMPSAVGVPARPRRRDGRPAGADRLGRSLVASLQIDVPADDASPTAPRGVRTSTRPRCSARHRLPRHLPGRGPAGLSSRILDPRYVGEALRSGPEVREITPALQGPAGHHRDPRHRRALGGGQDRRSRARKIPYFLSQPFFVAEQFTGLPGGTPIDETIASSKALTEGEYDHLPEQAFFLVGGIEEAVERAKQMEAA